jgi:PAS domain S-box-containing protein
MPTILLYGIGVLSVAIAIALGLFVLRNFEAILTPFLFAVAATVWYAGIRPGVLAIVLSVLSLNYFFLRPGFSFSPISYADLVYLAFCIFCALAVGWVSAVRRRAEQELRQARDEFEAKVLERTANLQRSESYLAETQKLTHTGSWAWDARSQKVLYCSEEMFRIYGLDPQLDLPTRKNFRQRVHPEDRGRTDERFARVVNEKVDSFDEYRVLLPDGTVKHVNSSGHPVLDGNGEFIAFIGTATDVTERKRAEEALRESEAKIRRLVNSNIIGIFVWDFDGRIVEANDEFLRMVNYDREDLASGRIRWTDLTPPDWRERDNAKIEQQKISGRLEPFEKEYTRKDGRRVPVLIGVATFEEGGNQGVAFVLDLTERKRAEEALRESERNARSALDGIAGLVAIMTPIGEVETVNRQCVEYFGRPVEEQRDWVTTDMVHPEDLPRMLENFKRAIASEIPYHFEQRLRRFDGEYRWFETRGGAVRDDTGRIVRWYVLLTDIEDRKRAEDALRESEYKLRQIFETVPSHLWSADPDFEPTRLNQHLLDYFGMRPEEFMHGGWQAFLHPDDLPETAKAISHAVQTGTYFKVMHRLRRADGEFRWHNARGEPMRDEQGNIIQWYGLSVDIDEAKKTEDRLRRSEAYLSEAQRLSHTGSAAYNGTEVLYWSEEASRIWGLDPSQGIPSREAVWQRIHPDDRDEVDENMAHGVREKSGFANEFRIILPDGTIKHIEATNHPVLSASGELLEIVATGIDVTERKRAEQALREREAQLAEARRELRQMIDTIPIPVASYSTDATRDFVNAAWKQYTGLSDEAALGTKWSVVAHPDDTAGGDKMWRDALATGEPWHTEERVRRADGQYRWFSIDRVAARDENGKIIKWYGTAYDIEDRKRAEDALRENEAKFRDYAETASDWFWETGPDYRFTVLTENAFGSAPAQRIGTVCWDHALDVETEPEKWRLVWAALHAREPFRDFVYSTIDGSGAPMYVKASGKPVFDGSGKFLGYRGTGSDVTAIVRGQRAEVSLRTVQAELAHVSRVMTLGQLTASIAHEVNQPIGSARNNARAALNFLDKSPSDLGEVREALGCIVADADRAGGIIDRIRDQIKKVPPRSDRFDLNQAIEEVIGLAQSMITENGVSVQRRLARGMAPVHGDRVQLQQVVLNLILNAVEAMRSVEADERQVLISTDHSEANGTLVAVRDSGPGIDPKHLELVFEAFYSTTSGMGMGLSICRSIIAAHGGRLWAEANEPGGAVFQFTLPNVQAKSSIARPFTTLESRKKTSL